MLLVHLIYKMELDGINMDTNTFFIGKSNCIKSTQSIHDIYKAMDTNTMV